MPEPVLYSFRRCPYAMRARMALHASATPLEHREVVLRDKPAAMLRASPKGTVPVLVLPDGTVLDESVDIMCWALERSDPEGWLDRDDRALVAMIDGPFKHRLDRYKYATRYDDVDPFEHRTAAVEHLEVFEDRLDGSPYLTGNTRGFVDIATFPFIRQFANTAPDWFAKQPLPRVQAWLDRLVSSDLFAAIMEKRPVWQSHHKG